MCYLHANSILKGLEAVKMIYQFMEKNALNPSACIVTEAH